MIRVTPTSAVAALPKARYPRESIASAALAVGERAKVFLEEKGGNWVVTLKPARKLAKAELLDVAGALLNEALSHAFRQKVVALNRAFTAPVLARARAAGFPNMPPDPLEQLEPQVREDRLKDVEGLMEAARKWL